MFDKVLIKNITSLFGIKVASLIIPLVTLPYLVRVLGVEGYGYLGFSLAITQYFILVVNYGFDLSATSSIAKIKNNKSAISRIFWSIILIRVISTIISLIILLAISLYVPDINKILPILLSCFLTVIGIALFPQWLFQGKEQLGFISTARIILQIVSIPLLFLFIKDGNDIWKAAVINSIPFLGIAIVSIFILIKRRWVCWYKPSINDLKNELVDGWHIFISTAAINLYTSSVTVVLGIMSGPVSVGYFTAADKIIKVVLGLYAPISNAFYPRINSAVSESKDAAVKLIYQLSKIQITISALTSFTILFMGEWIVELLYGDGFSNTLNLLKILCWLPIVIGLSNIFGIQTMITFGYKKEFSKILIISGVFSVFLLIPLIYFYNEYGAALSVLITETLVTILMWAFIRKNEILKLKDKEIK